MVAATFLLMFWSCLLADATAAAIVTTMAKIKMNKSDKTIIPFRVAVSRFHPSAS